MRRRDSEGAWSGNGARTEAEFAVSELGGSTWMFPWHETLHSLYPLLAATAAGGERSQREHH